MTLHLRLSPRSEGTVDEAELRLLGPDGMLINTARGPVVNQAALVRALNEGWIRGAALDVYDQEPLPAGHPLLTAPNTLLTPHLGFVTHESYAQFYGGAFEDVKAWLAGAPVRLLTEPAALSPGPWCQGSRSGPSGSKLVNGAVKQSGPDRFCAQGAREPMGMRSRDDNACRGSRLPLQTRTGAHRPDAFNGAGGD